MWIEWTQTAEADLEYIVVHIAADNVSAALMMDDRIRERIRLLADYPEMGREGRYAGTRELVFPRDRAVAVYEVSGESIVILRILHGSQIWPTGL